MDSRGIPIVVKTNNTTPKRSNILTPSRYNAQSSSYFVASVRNEMSLLEAYDSFADACFLSHYNHSMTNSDFNYSVRDMFRSEFGIEKKEAPSSPLKRTHSDWEEPPETPKRAKSRLARSSQMEQELESLDMKINGKKTVKEPAKSEEKKGRVNRSKYKSLKQVEDIYMKSLEKVSECQTKKKEEPKTKKEEPNTPPKGRMTRSRYKSMKQVEDIYLTSLQVLSKPSPSPKPPRPETETETTSTQIQPKQEEKSKRLTESEKERKRYEAHRKQQSDYEIKKIMEAFPGLAHYYQLIEKTGSGTFSRVYKARDLLVDQYMPFDQKEKYSAAVGKRDKNYVAIKLVLDISTPARIANEIECLLSLRSSPGVTPLITAFRHESLIFVVQPFIEFDHFDDFYTKMTMDDIRCYVRELLVGLKSTHEKGIMHRDVKPGNFLYNYKTKKGYLADFGLAQQSSTHQEVREDARPPSDTENGTVGYYPNDTRPAFRADRSGTRGFRAPELLLRYRYQTTAVDIWAVGVIMLIILTGRYPFFEPEDDAEGILELAHIFGITKIKEFTEYYGRRLHTNIPTIPKEEVDLARLCKDLNEEQIEKWDNEEFLSAVDLMKKCLSLIHTKRPTALEALNHPFIHRQTCK